MGHNAIMISAVSTITLGALGAMAAPAADYTFLGTFDGAAASTQKWHELNDPTMGGQSTATFKIAGDGYGIFNGTVRIVPSLKAPGFANAETYAFQTFPSGAGFDSVFIVARTTTPDYEGFKLSWAADTLSPQFASFKSRFRVTSADWQVVNIPLNEFSNDWSSFTGDCFTKDPTGKQHFCCSSDHPEVCPKSAQLGDVNQLGVWAEGFAGDFHLEVKAIGAGNYEL